MGMWVEQFNSSKPVQYVHSLKFCQFGCIEDYYTAHYQSPRQMICMWGKLQTLGRPQCCNMRWWFMAGMLHVYLAAFSFWRKVRRRCNAFRIWYRTGRETSFAVSIMCCTVCGSWVSHLRPCINGLPNSFIISISLFPFFLPPTSFLGLWSRKMMRLDV